MLSLESNVSPKRKLLWESDEDTEEISFEFNSGELKRKRLLVGLAFFSILSLEGDDVLGVRGQVRTGNKHRDRSRIIAWSKEIDDVMFRRQFRLHSIDFHDVLLKINVDLDKSVLHAVNSSGSAVSPYLMLMITLRILAGASYLDMIHYHVHVDSISRIVWQTVESIHRRIDNIKVARNDSECKALATEWSEIQLRRWGTYVAVGTIYAGDGLVLEIQQPSLKELRGRSISIFRNRKGFWGLIAQGFCDTYTRFSVLDVKWPGGTNDIVAYRMSDLCHLAMNGHFPEWASFVLDEAYSSLGRMHLTPYSSGQLK